MTELTEKLKLFVADTDNPIRCYEVGMEYSKIGQLPAAQTFFTKAAEKSDDKILQYECLLRIHSIFVSLGNRATGAVAMAQRAIVECPNRPEAYYLLVKFFESNKQFHQALVYAQLALEIVNFDSPPLRGDIEFPGKYKLLYHKATNLLIWGMEKQAREVIQLLSDNYADVMDSECSELVYDTLLNKTI